jgi:hypothetical protein
MKPTDVLILSEVQKINRRLIAMQSEHDARFDQIDEQLDAILKEVEESPVKNRHISPELERAIKEAALHARRIDEKVSDL